MIYFVRHGQSTANAGGVTMEHADIPLSELGHAQAKLLAELLYVRPTLVLTSSYLRARQTAVPFCEKTGCVAKPHPLVHEFFNLDPDHLVGMTGVERGPIAAAYWQRAEPTWRAGPRAETFAELDARVTAFKAEMASLPEDTVVFGHGMWTALLIWKLLGFSAADSVGMRAFRRFQVGLPMPNCAVYSIEQLAPSRWCVRGDESIMHRIQEASAAITYLLQTSDMRFEKSRKRVSTCFFTDSGSTSPEP